MKPSLLSGRRVGEIEPTIEGSKTDSTMDQTQFIDVKDYSGSIYAAVSASPSGVGNVSFWDATDPTSISSLVSAISVAGSRALYLTNTITMFVANVRGGNDEFARINTWSTAPSLATPTANADLDQVGSIARLDTSPFNRFYMASSSGNIVTFNSNNPPGYVGTVSNALFSQMEDIVDLDIGGLHHVVCVAPDDDYLHVLDVETDSDVPDLVGSLTDSDLNGCRRLVVCGTEQVAVLSPLANTVTIVDVSTASAPSITGTLTDATYFGSLTGDIAFDGTYLMVTDPDNDSVVSIDISTPSAPTRRGVLTDGTNLNGVTKIDGVSGLFYAIVPLNDGFVVISA